MASYITTGCEGGLINSQRHDMWQKILLSEDKIAKHEVILGKIGKPTSNPDVRMKSAINAPPQLLDVRSHAIHGPLNYLRLSSCVILGGGGFHV